MLLALCLHERARVKTALSKVFFPRNEMFSSLESPLAKSRQQTTPIILQFSTPLNQVNHCLNGLNNGKNVPLNCKPRRAALLTSNVQPLCRLCVRYSYTSHKLSLRFRYFRCVEYKPENTSATIWTNE